ncbi:hypothetical protein BMS3Bbin11_01796 [bacterium BMS3Bbin11]|nr:hypothetical protein BMS3Abin11_02367 [bacterium BMS3Abin11]GBE46695.1 hypothetical protein BMS3Bbin11_01796 [bacterium BMS3Bbin11]HDH08351.1 hypothetical protein [Gammaproteobacteria bacterium]HDH16895.1 hypothetical protein [Gammaproteobacteria bacterium]HDZ78266.1 hypothetical protein [Gammaproteobacteria bacterium]
MINEETLPSILHERGFCCEKIACRKGMKTPDFLVKCSESSYLIELKEKFSDPNRLAVRDAELVAGKVAGEIYKGGYNNSVSSIIEDAVSQLASDAAPKADFRLVWLHAQGHLPDLQIDNIKSTLYGIATIVGWGKEKGFSGECLYFCESEFFRHRSVLDGVIMTFEDQGQLCLNDCSPRYADLKSSALCRSFNEAVIDPVEIEKDSGSIVLRTNIDRRDSSALLSFLRDTYGMMQPHKMDMKHCSGTVLVSGI